jgi:hypothetical protein
MKKTFPMRVAMIAAVAAAFAMPSYAQKPDAAAGTVVVSEPGKATATRAAELSAQVVAIDKATRTLTLKGPQGDSMDLVAGDEVRNFDQIKLGDFVVARYLQSLTLELQKTRVKAGEPMVREEAGRAAAGERPAAGAARQVTALADVTAVDPKKSTITLKGPRGNVVTLPVQNPEQFKVVKKGDQVQVTYTEAMALSVEPAPKPAAAKKQ